MENMKEEKKEGIFKGYIDEILNEEALLRRKIDSLQEIKEKCAKLESDYVKFEKSIDEEASSQVSKLDEILKTMDATAEENSVYKDIVNLKNKIIDQANLKKQEKKSEITDIIERLCKESKVMPEKREELVEKIEQKEFAPIEIIDSGETLSEVEKKDNLNKMMDASPETTLKEFVKIKKISLTPGVKEALNNQFGIWNVPISLIMNEFKITDQGEIESIITNFDNLPKLGMIGFRYNEDIYGITAFNGKSKRIYGGRDTLGVSHSNYAG